jgi:hypothetical protein
MSDAGDCWMM